MLLPESLEPRIERPSCLAFGRLQFALDITPLGEDGLDRPVFCHRNAPRRRT